MARESSPAQGGCWKWGCGIATVPLVLLAALYIWAQVTPAAPDPSLDFLVACQSAVRDRLTAPSTARFGPETASDVRAGPGGYRLIGTVEAQNALGVPLRTAYACTGTPERVDVGIF